MPDRPVNENDVRRLGDPLVVSRIGREGDQLHVVADADELAEIAELLGVLAVRRIEARLTVAVWRRDGVSVRGNVEAEIVQESVISLEPVIQNLRESVHLLFVPQHSRLVRPDAVLGGELELDPEGDDPPETFTGDHVDLGTALREIVALGLDPYPREDGESFEEEEEAEEDAETEEREVSPFAALARLRGEGKPE